MKKLFLLLTAVLLSAGMVVQAQLRDGMEDTQESETIPQRANLLKGRNNAPMTEPDYTWDELVGTSNIGRNNSSYILYQYSFKTGGSSYPWFNFYINFEEAKGITYNNYLYPAIGNYTITSSLSTGNMICDYDCKVNGSWKNSYYKESGTTYYFYGGSATAVEGYDERPYMTFSITCLTTNGNNCYSGTWYIGYPATYQSITVNSADASMGSVSHSYKNGAYAYPNNRPREYKTNSYYTLTATPNSGYRFVCWKKNGTQISTDATTDVQITGDATYTAYFEANGAPQYTITVQADNDDYCTVSGSGTYYAGTEVTISSTSKNPHLYIFDMFMLEGEDEDQGEPSFNITVTGDATYTAYYRLANPGTISATAAHGTVSGTGYYAGGTAVSLGVTAADGYVFTQWSDGNQDNPRTVYVDGNASYTAQFVQGVAINVEMGRLGVYDSDDDPTMNDGSGNAWFHIIGKSGDYEVRFESYGKSFTGGQVYGTSDVDQNYSWIKRNGVNVPLNFSDISATATLNRTYGGKYGIYDISIRMVGTDGTVYLTTGQCVRAIYYDTADDYAFPKMNYNFNAPSFMSSIPEDYGPNIYTYTADDDGKWLYLKQSINSVDYYLRLCFKVAGNSIPTGTYHLNATGSGIPVGTAIPTLIYNTSTTGGYWPNEVRGSNVFMWEQAGDENAYWWFLQYGTINVVNTNGVYYVEVDAINSFAEPVRFTMGTPPAASYTLGWDANGKSLTGGTPAGSVDEGESITAPTSNTPGYTVSSWSPAFTGTMPGNNVTYVAQWSTIPYTITYNENGGSTVADGNYNIESATVTLPTTSEKTGYTFGGWYANSGLTGDAVTTIPTGSTGNKEYWAKWNTVTYTITYNENGGSTMADGSYNIESATITLPTTSEKTGYTFGGWYTNSGLTGDAVTTIPTGSTGNKEYWAKWNTVTYTITFNENGGSTVADGNYNVESATITLPTTSEKTGYTFGGWYTNSGLTGDPVTTIPTGSTGNKEFWAKWNTVTYTITYNENGGSTVADGNYNIESATVTLPTTSEKTGYTFGGWYTNSGLTGDAVTTIPTGSTGNKEYWAKWNTVTYTITYNENGGSTVADGNYNVESATITLPTTSEKTGYTFGGWYTNSGLTGDAVTTIPTGSTGNKEYWAKWNANTHNVSWVTDGNALTGEYTNGTTAYGTTIVSPETPTKDATAEYTYAFDAWSPAVDATMPDNDVEYTATWTQTPVNYTLTWSTDGDALTGDYTHGTVAYGTTIVAPATPTKTGYNFTGWTPAVAATMPAANTTYTATWELQLETVELLDNENTAYYTTFKTNYNGAKVNAKYTRTFVQGRWSTLCLPFNVTSGQMMSLKMKGRVYEFNHAEGDANIGDELVLYFAAAKSLEAGKCYIVNANSALAGMSSFTFSSVTINLAADNVADLTAAGAYNNLHNGYKQSGNIELVGTLRKGTLKGTGEHETYMGLKDNKIYYPNTDPEKGSTVLAYRGVFRSTTALNAQRVRIVAEGDEGEEVTELEVVNGELQAVPETRKFIRDGVLYIEREGVIYDAAGQRVE